MRLRRKKRVVLALGAGGARGLAHIGVIRALKESEIPIDYIVGVSFGSIVG
ncbi:MAG: patatin-like phospholipase family protein, partial [Deltaproteobacteria bacterium]|nr:patatin-like phospholipase family protein [Deltaproteobacteria bacterium]